MNNAQRIQSLATDAQRGGRAYLSIQADILAAAIAATPTARLDPKAKSLLSTMRVNAHVQGRAAAELLNLAAVFCRKHNL